MCNNVFFVHDAHARIISQKHFEIIVLIEVFLSRTRTGGSGTINIQEEAKVTKERNSSDNRQTMRVRQK